MKKLREKRIKRLICTHQWMNEETILYSVVSTAYSREKIESLRRVFDVIHLMSESIYKNVLQAWQLVCTTVRIHQDTPSTHTYLSYFWWAAENALLLSTTIGYSRGVHSTTIEEWPDEGASVQTISLHAVSSSGWLTFKCQQLAIIVS